MNNVEIRLFRGEDQPATRCLILAGLQEHWEELDESKNPDLDDIEYVYTQSVFSPAVARVKSWRAAH